MGISLIGNSNELKGTNTSCKSKMLSKTSPRRGLMKRKPRRAPRRKSKDLGFETKVRTLERLIPNHESKGSLEGLFRDTADYILALQMRVRVMQLMVDALEDGYNTTTSHE